MMWNDQQPWKPYKLQFNMIYHKFLVKKSESETKIGWFEM